MGQNGTCPTQSDWFQCEVLSMMSKGSCRRTDFDLSSTPLLSLNTRTSSLNSTPSSSCSSGKEVQFLKNHMSIKNWKMIWAQEQSLNRKGITRVGTALGGGISFVVRGYNMPSPQRLMKIYAGWLCSKEPSLARVHSISHYHQRPWEKNCQVSYIRQVTTDGSKNKVCALIGKGKWGESSLQKWGV